MGLRLFLDSADPQAWSQWLPSGLFHGITTNPTLLKQAGQPCRLDHLQELSRRALDLGCRELQLQAWGGDASSYLACGQQLSSRLRLHLYRALFFCSGSQESEPSSMRIGMT